MVQQQYTLTHSIVLLFVTVDILRNYLPENR